MTACREYPLKLIRIGGTEDEEGELTFFSSLFSTKRRKITFRFTFEKLTLSLTLLVVTESLCRLCLYFEKSSYKSQCYYLISN